MTRRHADIVVLCEDTCQQNLARGYLKAKKFEPSKLRFVPPPHGAGSGKQHVLANYAVEVGAYRRKANHLSLALVVAVDADNDTVDEVHLALARALEAAQQGPRGADERIVILVPKRNVETWVRFLDGHPVDESSDYTAEVRPGDCQPAGRKLAATPRGQPPPSLAQAQQELHRLPE